MLDLLSNRRRESAPLNRILCPHANQEIPSVNHHVESAPHVPWRTAARTLRDIRSERERIRFADVNTRVHEGSVRNNGWTLRCDRRDGRNARGNHDLVWQCGPEAPGAT